MVMLTIRPMRSSLLVSDTRLSTAFCRYLQEAEFLRVHMYAGYIAQFVYESAGWHSTLQVLRRKSEILLAYIRQCVAALVDRELIKTYIENQTEHMCREEQTNPKSPPKCFNPRLNPLLNPRL